MQLIDRYFAAGMERLIENNEQDRTRLRATARRAGRRRRQTGRGRTAAALERSWTSSRPATRNTRKEHAVAAAIDKKNKAQQQLRDAFDPFFSALHEGLKRLDKTVRQHEKQQTEQAQQEGKRAATDRRPKALKSALEELHQDVKNAEIYFQHIHWLQERFPNAEYEDVTGLCKLATPEEVKEQDYSLNPGRYVGVVIEEDGKTRRNLLRSF